MQKNSPGAGPDNRQKHHHWLLASLLWPILLLSSLSIAQSRETVMVPMRDGVNLATNIYLPSGEGPWPVVLTRTPYDKDGLDNRADTYHAVSYTHLTLPTKRIV